MKLSSMIDQVENQIFEFDVAALPASVSDLMAAIIETSAIDVSDPRVLGTFNKVMTSSLQAMQNRDYLLLADIIHYDLMPLIGLGK